MGDWDDHSARSKESSSSDRHRSNLFKWRRDKGERSSGDRGDGRDGRGVETIHEDRAGITSSSSAKQRGSVTSSSKRAANVVREVMGSIGHEENSSIGSSADGGGRGGSSSKYESGSITSERDKVKRSQSRGKMSSSSRSASRPRDISERGRSDGATSSSSTRDKMSRHRSKSRARSKSRVRAREDRDRDRDRDRDSMHRARSKSRSRAKAEESYNNNNNTDDNESLRDHYKRRAEDRLGSSSGNSIDDDKYDNSRTGSSRSGSSRMPPPPPRDASTPNTDKSTRSKSRGRNATNSGSYDGSSPRKVDSIASAIGHSKKSLSSSTSSTTNYGSNRDIANSSISNSLTPYGSSPLRTSSRPQSTSLQSDDTPIINEDNNNNNNNDSDLLISPLHQTLEKATWPSLHQHILHLKNHAQRDEIAAQLSLPHPRDGGTVLHVAAWKAPPALAVEMMRLMPSDSREMAVLQSIRDGEGNTPLHLCCGNLEFQEEDIMEGGGGDKKQMGYCLAVLKEIVKAAPSKAWTMQNSEGDTPLHMLVTSPLCSADPNFASMYGSSSSSSFMSICSKMATEAVRLALTTDPAIGSEAATMKERSGGTPLHVALAHGAHESVIEALLDAAPSAAMMEDNRGMLPLHWAAAFCRTGPGVIKRLIEEYPQALVHSTVDGDIPLHLAVANAMIEQEEGGRKTGGGGDGGSDGKVDKNRLKIVELLMQDGGRKGGGRDGDAISPILTTNREKLTPLHCCALFDAPPQISKLLMKHPDSNAASSMTNSFGATPLHLAAAQPGVSQSIATVLAIGTPDAAAVQDRLKRTPLHVAAQNTYATNLLIKTLAELNPEAAAVKTQRGHLPLHLAAQSQAKEPVIRALIKAYPAAAEAKNKSNNTPLHDAAKYRASLGVVRLLLDAYPGALYVQNQYGNLPLHCATAYQAPGDVVQLLLKSWPEGASMQNRNQDAPLHYAAAYATSAAAVRPLIDAAPAAVLLLNSSGQSPVDRAKANNAPDDIVELLESAAEDYSRNAASDGWASFGQGN